MIIHYHIKEQSFIARIAAFNLRKDHAAIVIHRTIHLWGLSKADFQAQPRYVNHEFQHLYQYQQLGTIRFLIEYLIESMRKGYYENKFEIEARNAETTTPLADFILIPK